MLWSFKKIRKQEGLFLSQEHYVGPRNVQYNIWSIIHLAGAWCFQPMQFNIFRPAMLSSTTTEQLSWSRWGKSALLNETTAVAEVQEGVQTLQLNLETWAIC